jgi:hypothetical protein
MNRPRLVLLGFVRGLILVAFVLVFLYVFIAVTSFGVLPRPA